MLNKRAYTHRILITIVVTLLLLISSSVLLSAQSLAAVRHITLTLAGDPRTTQTITWQTDAIIEAGMVQFSEVSLFPHKAVTTVAEVERMSTNLGDINIHFVTLIGLKPGTRYIYRVGDGSNWSEPRIFSTSAVSPARFKFLVFGDSQSINYDVWHNTLHKAYQANNDAAFFTNVGDLVDVGQDYDEWDAWFTAGQGVIDSIPVMPITGNHENYTPERRFSMPLFFTAQFKLPSTGPEGLLGHVYYFDYGDVHFVMLDSQQGEERQFAPDMLDKQKAWLEKDLSSTDKKWKVAFVHRSPYNNKEMGGNDNIRAAFVPAFDKYHVDAVFTGHDHAYARSYPLYEDAVVASHDKGTVYVAAGRSGTKTYQDNVSKDWNEFYYNPFHDPNYITVEVTGEIMTVKAFNQDGVLIDEWSIDKTRPAVLEKEQENRCF